MLRSLIKLSLLPSAAAVLVACGGGGGGSPQQPSSFTFGGVVAIGAALSDAKVDVYEATGEIVGSATTAEDGTYTIVVTSTAKMPLTFKAVKEDIVLFSPVATSDVARVNVTPLTNLVAAQLSPTGNPAQLIEQIKSGDVVVNANKVQAVVSSLNEALAPLFEATKVSAIDPVSGSFNADGAGYDQALNSMNITINPTGQSSNIIVTVKAAATADEGLPEIKFVSSEKPPALPPSVAEAKLPPPSTDGLIQAFLGRLNGCYALPAADRIQDDNTVKAPICKQIFYNDDPKTFKNNGAVVGNGTGKAWASLWNENAQGVKFSSGSMLYLEKNGDMLISWRGESKEGTVTHSRTWVRPENGQLKAYGNQYKYPFIVRPTAEARDSINTDKSYFSTGFSVYLANIAVNQAPIFEKVEVTAPSGRTTQFVPQSSLSYLSINNTSTSLIRLAGQFWSSDLSNRSPRELNEGLVWAKNKDDQNIDWQSAEIKSIPNVGVWKAEFFMKGNTTNKPDEVQYSVVTSRPLTIDEIRNRTFVKLADGIKDEIKKISSGTGYLPFEDGDKAELVGPNDSDVWVVPPEALKPTLLKPAGYYLNSDNQTRTRWDDSISLSINQRKAVVSCSSQGSNDLHCSKTVDGGYSERARMDMIQLFAYDSNEIEWMSFFTIYKTDFRVQN